jgi:hypothetical protein
MQQRQQQRRRWRRQQRTGYFGVPLRRCVRLLLHRLLLFCGATTHQTEECNLIEAPCLVNGGHGASLRHHKEDGHAEREA